MQFCISCAVRNGAHVYKSLRMAVKYCQTVIYIYDDNQDDGDDDDDDDECSLFQQCVDTRFTDSWTFDIRQSGGWIEEEFLLRNHSCPFKIQLFIEKFDLAVQME